MRRIKKFLTRPVALILCLVLLGGSMAAAALNASPYDMLKDAAFNLLTAESAAIDITVRSYADGVLADSDGAYVEFSPDALYSNPKTEIHSGLLVGYPEFVYSRSPLHITTAVLSDENLPQYTAILTAKPVSVPRPFQEFSELKRTDFYVRFAELALDTLVGSLKNNINARDEANGVKYLSGTLTAAQVPELYNAAFSVYNAMQNTYIHNSRRSETVSIDGDYATVLETQIDLKAMTKTVTTLRQKREKYYWDSKTGEYFDASDPRASEEFAQYSDVGSPEVLSTQTEPLVPADFGEDKEDHPMKNVRIDYVSGEARIDKSGNFVDGNFTVRFVGETVFDEVLETEFVLDCSVSGVGSTEPQCPIPGAQELFTEEFIKSVAERGGADSFYYSDTTVYFDLLPDGSIDLDSVISAAEYWERKQSPQHRGG
ncbi:MAG: hypothetical protein LBR85_01110 [Oscillospiraceae bacterium]|jgi:hypothetical protein|nr:hypothetical protein [Oscillospiraceae bacterium]